MGVTSTDFWVGDSTELKAKSGRSPPRTDRSRWPGRPRRREGGGEGGAGGVERFGGGEGKAHLLYSWPLSVKQALWAVTERRAFSSLVPPSPSFPPALGPLSVFLSIFSCHIFILTALQPGKSALRSAVNRAIRREAQL